MSTSDARQSLLVIDDESSWLAAARVVVESLGYRFVGALGAKQGLELMASGPLPAAVLVDLYMPGMDAVEFRIAQLANPRLATVPMVIVVATAVTARLAESIGVPLVQKPLTAAVLSEAIGRAEASQVRRSPLPWSRPAGR